MKSESQPVSARQDLADRRAASRYTFTTSDSRHNSPHFRGTMQVSTFEVTALDLVGYHHHGSGLNQVAAVLSVLYEPVDSALTIRRGLPQGLIPQ